LADFIRDAYRLCEFDPVGENLAASAGMDLGRVSGE
jgi:hypothetical protein